MEHLIAVATLASGIAALSFNSDKAQAAPGRIGTVTTYEQCVNRPKACGGWSSEAGSSTLIKNCKRDYRK